MKVRSDRGSATVLTVAAVAAVVLVLIGVLAVVGAVRDVHRARAAADLAALADGRPAGVALGRLLVTRLPDWRANLVARALVTDDEAETYVRHNVRGLGAQYPPEQVWRLLVRYLFEYQYLGATLGLVRIADPQAYFVASTGIADELFGPGVLDEARFDDLAGIVARLCAAHAIDSDKLRLHMTVID